MKKFLLSVIAMAGVFTMAAAREVSIVFSEKGYENATELVKVALNADVTLDFDKGDNSNSPKYYNSGTAARLYGGNSMTVTGATGVTLTKVEFTTGSSNPWNTDSKASAPTFTVADNLWAGSANSVKFTQGGTTGHVRITKIVITYDGGTGGAAPVDPDQPVATGATFEKVSAIESGSKYLFVIDGKFGACISSTATYGRLNLTDCTIADNKFTAKESNALTITEVAGKGYTIQDADGRYYGMDAEHKTSFQIYTEVNDGCYWTAAWNAGTVTFTNALNTDCIICRSTGAEGTPYTNIAPAAVADGQTLPELFKMTAAGSGETPVDPTPETPADAAIYYGLGQAAAEIDWTFDNGTLPEGITYVWSWKEYNGAHYLNASAYVNKVAYAVEAWAVSPAIDLAGYTDVTATFDQAAKFQTTIKDLCGLYIREAGATTWTQLNFSAWPEAGTWNFSSCGLINLKAYEGKKVQFGFKYGSTADGADTWEIRDFKVNGEKKSGIADVDADLNAPVEYFNLQGVRVAADQLVPGLYITRQGGKTSKVVVK